MRNRSSPLHAFGEGLLHRCALNTSVRHGGIFHALLWVFSVPSPLLSRWGMDGSPVNCAKARRWVDLARACTRDWRTKLHGSISIGCRESSYPSKRPITMLSWIWLHHEKKNNNHLISQLQHVLVDLLTIRIDTFATYKLISSQCQNPQFQNVMHKQQPADVCRNWCVVIDRLSLRGPHRTNLGFGTMLCKDVQNISRIHRKDLGPWTRPGRPDLLHESDPIRSQV